MRRPGPPPAPRKTLHPKLTAKVKGDRRSSWLLAQLCGFPQQSDFSEILHADRVIATPLTVDRLHRLAALLAYPPEEIFLPEAEEVQP